MGSIQPSFTLLSQTSSLFGLWHLYHISISSTWPISCYIRTSTMWKMIRKSPNFQHECGIKSTIFWYIWLLHSYFLLYCESHLDSAPILPPSFFLSACLFYFPFTPLWISPRLYPCSLSICIHSGFYTDIPIRHTVILSPKPNGKTSTNKVRKMKYTEYYRFQIK